METQKHSGQVREKEAERFKAGLNYNIISQRALFSQLCQNQDKT